MYACMYLCIHIIHIYSVWFYWIGNSVGEIGIQRCWDNRRKFRSQTSDNMDKWKAEVGRVREEKKEEKISKKITSQKKEDPGARKSRKVAKHCVFPMICGSGGSKSGSLKRRVRSHVVRWEMRSCTPLWREDARSTFPSQKVKTHQHRTTFGSWDVEKVHAVVARSTCESQNPQNTPCSHYFSMLRCSKRARLCGAKHISKSKRTKHTTFRALWDVEMSKQCTPLWREAHFEVKMYKALQPRNTFGSWDVQKVYAVVARSTFGSQNVQSTTCWHHFWTLKGRFVWQGQGFSTLPKASKTWGFCSISKMMAGVGHLKRICKDGFRVAGAVQETCSSEMLGGQAADFLRRVAFLKHQIFRFGKMILRDRCSTWYDLALLFRGRLSTLERWSGKIAKRNGTRPSALHLTFYSWRKSRRILSFLTLSSSNMEEVSQNCCVFSHPTWRKPGGSLAK